MYSSTAYTIRHASAEDAVILRYISQLDSQSSISANALIGEIHGSPAAAIELDSGRVVADPFRPTAELAAHLRARASGVTAVARKPRLRDRIRDGIRVQPASRTPIHQGGG